MKKGMHNFMPWELFPLWMSLLLILCDSFFCINCIGTTYLCTSACIFFLSVYVLVSICLYIYTCIFKFGYHIVALMQVLLCCCGVRFLCYCWFSLQGLWWNGVWALIKYLRLTLCSRWYGIYKWSKG